MAETILDAGRLNERLELLELKETQAGVWTWESAGRLWGAVEADGGKNLFSAVGIGARNARLVVRRRVLTLHQAMRWRGQHLFLTSITHRDRGHLDIQAALVAPVACRALRSEDTVGEAGRPVPARTMDVTFPGVLTEKFVRYQREEDHGEQEAGYVLVTGKAIRLRAGDLVSVLEGPAAEEYHVSACHVLDPWKNEYEILLGRDV